jgi:predicted Zn-dependent protease
MRADGWNRIPLVRMTTVSLEPGEWSFDDLIADTETGLYVETNNSWSIDDKRLNFQFACEIGWEIENGEARKMVKMPNYTGITPQFWGSCDAVCSRDHWQVWGLPNCGKGEPMQVAHVAHGARPARFRRRSGGGGSLMMTPRKARALARRAVGDDRRRRGRGARAAETSALTRFANNRINQNVAEENALVSVRAVSASEIGVASTNRLDDCLAEGVLRGCRRRRTCRARGPALPRAARA